MATSERLTTLPQKVSNLWRLHREPRQPDSTFSLYACDGDPRSDVGVLFIPGFMEPEIYMARTATFEATLSCMPQSQFKALSYYGGGWNFAPPISFTEMVRNAVSVFNQNNKRTILVGHSLGANVAAAVARQVNRANIAGIIYLGPTMPLSPGRLAKKLPEPVQNTEEARAQTQMLVAATETFREDIRFHSKQIMIVGVWDTIVLPDELRKLARQTPNIELREYTGGHSFFNEAAQSAVTAAVRSLVARTYSHPPLPRLQSV